MDEQGSVLATWAKLDHASLNPESAVPENEALSGGSFRANGLLHRIGT